MILHPNVENAHGVVMAMRATVEDAQRVAKELRGMLARTEGELEQLRLERFKLVEEIEYQRKRGEQLIAENARLAVESARFAARSAELEKYARAVLPDLVRKLEAATPDTESFEAAARLLREVIEEFAKTPTLVVESTKEKG